MRTFAIALALLLGACATVEDSRRNEVQKEIADATAAWVAAYNSRDGARIAAMYEPDAVLWGTASQKISPTPQAIADYFRDAGKRPKARVEIVEQHIRVFGDPALNA